MIVVYKLKLHLLLIFSLATLFSTGQEINIDLSFSAKNGSGDIKLDSISVMNRTSGETAMVFWPDTTVTLMVSPGDTLLYAGFSQGIPVSIPDNHESYSGFTLYPNFPNPATASSLIPLYLPEPGRLMITITDMTGQKILSQGWNLRKGLHTFRFLPGSSHIYLVNASFLGITKSLKIPVAGVQNNTACSFEYYGYEGETGGYKSGFSVSQTNENTMESGILDAPVTDKSYSFSYLTGIPCPGLPSITYEGQVYNTIQIYSQCWLKENLNVGSMIQVTEEQSDNGIIEKYCYENHPDSCTKYGGYYEWNEMMQYTVQQGARGICPEGWHIPTDEEWKVLEAVTDSEFEIGSNTWDEIFYRGNDAGYNLKSSVDWQSNGAGSDLFGFSCLPGGNRSFCGHFFNAGLIGYWWTSTPFDADFKWYRSLSYDNQSINRNNDVKESGFSVRCLKDQN